MNEPLVDRLAFELKENNYRLSYAGGSMQMGYYYLDRFVYITWSPIAEYEKMGAIPRGLVERAAHENINILEVGGGLAELTPALGLRAKVKPILVDPIDYNAVLRLFDQALVRNIHKSRKQLIQELIKRIAIITNPNHVHFFNTSLEEAVLYHPELHRTQDVVVDLAGALFYSSDPQLIWGIEKKWLPKIET